MKALSKKSFFYAGLLLALLTTGVLTTPLFPLETKSRVVVAKNPRAINDRNVCDTKETARLFDQALLALTAARTPAEAWKQLGLKPSDVVAVKVNCNNWTITLSPHPELVAALCRSLMSVIPANQIIVYDNMAEAITESGFTLNRSERGVRFVGTDQGFGFDPKERLTRLVTHTASKIINLASLKCVEGDMVASLFFKNHIGSLVPEDMSKCHNSQTFLAEVLSRPSIKNKTILNLLDGLRGSFRKGVPWYWGGIIMSQDPVAAETASIGVINEKRAAEKLSPLHLPESLKLAEAQFDLGTMNQNHIDLIRIDL